MVTLCDALFSVAVLRLRMLAARCCGAGLRLLLILSNVCIRHLLSDKNGVHIEWVLCARGALSMLTCRDVPDCVDGVSIGNFGCNIPNLDVPRASQDRSACIPGVTCVELC